MAALRPFCALCSGFLSTQLHPPGRLCSQKSSIFGVCLKNLAPADVIHLAAPPGQRVYGGERAGRRQSWQQEGEGSHKVATQSRRLACLSRVNIGPRLHTVMTNTGGRAQKHYQDYYPVLPDPTHAIPIIFLPLLSSKQARSFDIEGTSVIGAAPPQTCACLACLRWHSQDYCLKTRWIRGAGRCCGRCGPIYRCADQ